MTSPVREFLEQVSWHLEAALASADERRAVVVRGWEAVEWDVPEAGALRDAGADWDWVALAIPPTSFWDLHVGLLATERAGRPAVGLHWRPVLDAVVRPVALEVASAGTVHLARSSGEFQQEVPVRSTTPAETARVALDLALHVAAATAGNALDHPQA